MATKKQEDAVRSYLTSLKDPKALVPIEKIAELQRQIEEAGDQIERVRLRQQIMDAESPSLERFEKDFVEHARAWANDQGISAEAFIAEGVDPAVLRRAGLKVAGGRSSTRRRRTGGRTRVTTDEVRKAIPPRKTFTVGEVAEKSGASTATVNKVIRQLVADGELEDAGVAESHSGPGRAPKLYKRA